MKRFVIKEILVATKHNEKFAGKIYQSYVLQNGKTVDIDQTILANDAYKTIGVATLFLNLLKKERDAKLNKYWTTFLEIAEVDAI